MIIIDYYDDIPETTNRRYFQGLIRSPSWHHGRHHAGASLFSWKQSSREQPEVRPLPRAKDVGCRFFFGDYDLELLVQGGYITVKGQSRSDSLLLSPYHWAKLFRGVVAIVAVPMRFAVICWLVLEAFVGQIHVFPLGSWMTIQVLGLSRISFLKSYREAVRLEKVQVSHHHNF